MTDPPRSVRRLPVFACLRAAFKRGSGSTRCARSSIVRTRAGRGERDWSWWVVEAEEVVQRRRSATASPEQAPGKLDEGEPRTFGGISKPDLA